MDEKMSKDLLWLSIGVGFLGPTAARRLEERAASQVSERAKLSDLGAASSCRFMGNVAIAHVAIESFKQSPKFTGAVVLGALGLAALYVHGEHREPGHLVGAEGQHCFACAPGQRPIAYCAPGGVMPLPPPTRTVPSTGDWGPGF
jgi:hypothetical protein